MNGTGVSKDPVAALALSQLAFAAHDSEEDTAKSYSEAITAHLSTDQLGDVTRLYTDMRKTNVVQALASYRELRAKEAAISQSTDSHDRGSP